MKKAGIFAAVIALVLLFMQFYNYKLWGYTDDVMYVIDGEQAARCLKEGPKEGENRRLPLKRYNAFTPLYTRGDRYFAGEGYDPLDLSYPVYMNEGSFLYSFSDSMNLISTEFEVLNAYDGLYMAEGHSYNRDREMADPEEFVLLSTSAGLYMNLQDMVIHSGARDKKIPANSLLSLEEGKTAFFRFSEGSYLYEDYSDLIDAQVTIGSLHISYEELLKALGKLSLGDKEDTESGEEERKEEETKEPDTEKQELPGQEAAELEMMEEKGNPGENPMKSREDETKDQNEEKSQNEETDLTEEKSQNIEEENEKKSQEYIPDHPPIPKEANRWDYPDSGEEGDGDSEEEGSGNLGGGNGSSGEEGEGGGSGSGGSSQGQPGSPDSSFVMPQASLSPFTFGVYDASSSLTVSDPSFAVIKGVRLVFYEKDASRASYRKLYRSSGPVSVEPLKPDTEYEVEGYFDYEHPQYGKQREVFAQRAYCGRTLPISSLTPLEISQRPGEEIYPNGIQIKELTATSGESPQDPGTATKSQTVGQKENAGSGKSTLSYLSSVQMEFDKTGSPDWNSPEAVLGSSQLSALKRGEGVDWKTADILDSNSRYHYKMKFYDRFGNQLPIKDPSAAEGDARTSKEAPAASVRVSRDSNVNRLEVQIQIDNPDRAAFLDFQGAARPSLFITTASKPDAPIRFTVEGEKEEFSRYVLGSDSNRLMITSLLPGTSYTLWVRGSYDLEDGRTYENQVMGSALTTTDALSSLGTVNFSMEASDIGHSSALITSRMRSAVNQALYPYVSELELSLEKKGEKQFSFAMRKEELEKISIGPDQRTYLLREGNQGSSYDPQITVALPDTASDSMSVWDALLTTGELRAWYKEGNLASASDYKAVLRAKAVRGDSNGTVEEDVTGRHDSVNFKTLRQPVYVSYDMSFINGSTATFYDFRVNDPDQAVAGGNLTMRVRMATNNKVMAIYTYTVEQLAGMSELVFEGLEENTDYFLDVIALEYNEGYSTSSKELQKELYLEDQSRISFKTVNSLSGALTVESMKNGYQEQKPQDGIGVESVNLFDINDSVLDKAVGSTGLNTSNGNVASGYIRVDQGSAYYLGGGIGTSVVEYDQDQTYLRNIDRSGIYVPSQSAAYIRVNVSAYNMGAAYVSRMLYGESDSKANLIRSQGVSIKQGSCLREKTAPNGDKSVTEESNQKAASTDFISFDSSKPLIRLYASPGDAGTFVNRDYRAAFFYDQDHNYVGSVDLNNLGGMIPVTSYPKGAVYVRLNLSGESEKSLFLGQPSDQVYGENLLADSRVAWHDGSYGTWNNRYTDQGMNKHKKYSDYVAVKPSTVYETSSGCESIQVFDSKKNFLGYLGRGVNLKIYLRTPENAAYVRVNADFKEDHSRFPVLRQSSPAFDQTAVTVGFGIRLEDQDRYLGEDPAFTLEYEKTDSQGQVSQWKEEYAVDGQSRVFQASQYLKDQEPGCHFTVTQTVEIGGHRIVLDTLAFDTSRAYNIISSEAGLRMANYSNMDHYIVTSDIEVNQSYVIDFFYGKIDFGGHRLVMKDQRTLVQYLYEGAEITNLSAEITPPKASLSNGGILIRENRGTVSHVVLRTKLDNQLGNYTVGGIACTNYGTIDRFAVELTGKFYVQSNAGAVAGTNYGQITNGYVVGQEGSTMIVDPDAVGQNDRSNRGGIAGNNANGRIEHVYSVLVVEDHFGENEGKEPAGTEYAGLVAGRTSGEVSHAFGVGMVLKNDVPLKTNGPVLGFVSGKTSQISYVETQAFSDLHYNNIYNNQVTVSSLWDKTWMDQSINGDGAFATAVVADGYYPQVAMSGCMEGKQPLYRLPTLYTGSVPKVISVQVLEHTDDTARIQVGFENKNRMQIKGMDIAVMNMDSSSQRVYESAAKAQVESQGADEEGNYYAVLSISQPSKFRSKYYINHFTIGLEGTDSADQVVSIDDREKTEMILDFYEPITSLDQWQKAFSSNQIDRYGNYRLKADRFDFGNLSSSDLKKGYRITGSGKLAFCGSIDGGWTDEQGERHTVTLEHLDLSEAPFMIEELQGSLSNIRIRDMRIDENENPAVGSALRGFVGIVNGGQLDHIFVEDSQIHGYYMSGAITGQLSSGAVMRDCSVKDTALINYAPANNTMSRMGGLAGHVSASTIQNCFAQNLKIDSTRAVDMEGTGGIAGRADGTNCVISNCYATGELVTGYRYSGGIAGYFSSGGGTVKGCYSKVNIDAYSNFSGGIIGYLNSYETVSGNLSVGDLFVHSTSAEGVHRIAGYAPVSILSGNYGYAGQMYNNQVSSDDGDDGDGVFASQEMMEEASYRDHLKWGDSYAYSWESGGSGQSIAGGYMPLLKGRDGTILPGQTPVPVGTGSMRAEIQDFSPNGRYATEYEAMFGSSWPAGMPDPYVLQFSLYYDKEQYDIMDTYMEGMELNGYMGVDHKKTYTMEWSQDHYVIRYPFVTQTLGGDIYCLKIILQSKENPDIQITVSAAKGPSGGVSLEIGSAKEWNEVMTKYGNTYGNFTLTGDIDASETDGELVFNVKINRLSSKGGPYAIKHVTHQVTGFRESLIHTCLSGISNVRFENIQWEVPEDKRGTTYNYTSLIGLNQGTISQVEFKDVSIRSGKGNYTGCIGYSTGHLENITLTDIVAQSEGSYVGGLAGCSMPGQPASKITATGKLEQQAGEWDYRSSYEVSGVTRVGGIMGEGWVNDCSKANGILVSGKGTNPAYIGGMCGNGGIPEAGETAEEKQEKASSAFDMVVQVKPGAWDSAGNTPVYVGGLVGSGTVYYTEARNVLVDNPDGRYTGGIAGSANIYYSRVASDQEGAVIPKTRIRSSMGAGGVAGIGYGSNLTADGIEVKAAQNCAGGIVGSANSTLSQCTVDRTQVTAAVGAGGVAGEVLNSINSSLVARSHITASAYNAGGLAGQIRTSVPNLENNGVIFTEVKAETGNAETGAGNAGGLLGYGAHIGLCAVNYTKDVTVRTEGDYAGGLVGYGAGGFYERCYTDAKVEGKYGVGGFIGGLEASQRQVSSSYQDMKLYHSYSYGELKGKGNVGGFVGILTPGAGSVSPSPDNVYGLLSMAQMEVEEDGKWDFFLNMEQENMIWSGKALRLYEGASVNGKTAGEMDPWKEEASKWDKWKPVSAGGTEADGNKYLDEILTVTSENLMDKRLYMNTHEKGGMAWSGTWRTDGLGRMDPAPEKNPGVPGNVKLVQVTVTADGTPNTTSLTTDQGWPLYSIKAKDWNSISARMEEEEGIAYEWLRLYTPSNSVNNTNATGRFTTEIKSRETPLAGRGYYMGRITYADGKEGYTPILVMDSPAYMPYLYSGSDLVKGAQEGFRGSVDTEIDSKDPLEFYDGTDRLYYGGIQIPAGSLAEGGGMTLSMEEATVQVFPSGAASINLDLGPEYAGCDHVTVTDGDQVICDTGQMKRVYTLDYDYSRTLSVTLRSGEEAGTFTYDPTLLRRTVMVWGDEYYYICGNRVMSSKGTVLDVPGIHLYGGKALGADGQIYDLEGGTAEACTLAAWTPERETLPLWQAKYEGMTLKTMGSFTELDEGEEHTSPSVREQQLLVKNGTLYGMTGSTLFKGFVVDDYNGLVFASFLDEKGRLKDSGDGLKTPEDFDRTGIAHMSMSAGGTQPYVLVRYATGLAKGFNYVTGEELELENEISDVSFLDFAADLAGEFFGGDLEADKEFADLKKLEGQLTLAPITDGQLADAFGILGQAGEEGQDKEEKEDRNPAGAEDPDTGSQKEPEGEGAYGSNKGEKTGKTGPEGEKKISQERESQPEKGSENQSAEEPILENQNPENTGTEEAGSEKQNAENRSPEDPGAGNPDAEEPGSEKQSAENQSPEDPDAKEPGSKDQNPESLPAKQEALEEAENDFKGSGEKPGSSKESGQEFGQGEKNTVPENLKENLAEDPAESSGKERAEAGNVTYVYSFNSDGGKAALYRKSDLLTKKEEELMDEQEKLQLIQSAGIMTQGDVRPEKSQDQGLDQGILLIAASVGAAIGLTLLLIRRKRKF